MAQFLMMPKIGVNMTDGLVTEWLVKEGDEIKFGEMILQAETDKAVQDIPAAKAGTLLKILAPPGYLALCYTPLGIVGKPGENIDSLIKEFEAGVFPGAEAPAAPQEAAASSAAPVQTAAAPAARKRHKYGENFVVAQLFIVL